MAGTEILVFSEQPSLLDQLLGEARRKADPLGWRVGILAWGQTADAGDMGAAGAHVVYQGQELENIQRSELVVGCLAEAIRQLQPRLILIGGTKLGMESAARLAERLGLAYAPWAVDFKVSAQPAEIAARCVLYIGAGLISYSFRSGPLILTAAANVFKPQSYSGQKAAVEKLKLPALPDGSSAIERKPKLAEGTGVEGARVIVDVGQGVRQKEDLGMVAELAQLLDGRMACSRPVASDRDWFPEWLGLSGRKAAPELCLTVGLSGAIQHIIGIRDSQVIAAVNSDEGAPIFNQADYGMVIDLYEFVPALIERIKARGIKPAHPSK